MTTTHTPGPWEVKPVEKNKPYLRVRGTRLGCRYKICNVHMEHPDVAGNSAEAEANARLIAAAPELLAALQRAFAAMLAAGPQDYQQDDPETNYDAAIDAARAAIAKAKGTTT